MAPVGLFQIADCAVIRFFKMLNKLEILPILLGDMAVTSLRLPRKRISVLQHSARLNAAATTIGAAQMLWTAEAVEDLKKLALAGKSASHIAAALGVGSRNAVIGKASRIGIKLSGGGRAAASGATPVRTGRSQWATAPHSRPKAGDQGAHAPAVRCLSPRQERGPAWAFGDAEVGEMRRLRFEEIRESVCRWPLGDPRSGDFAYCGLTPVEGQSYCAGHCRMAYRPSHARPIARERQGFRAIAGS
jgi:GcrA cell cycle regulator